MKNKQTLFQYIFTILLFFTIAGMSQAGEYSGDLTEQGSGSSWSAGAEIPITLITSAFMQISFTTDPCNSTGGSSLTFWMLNEDGSTRFFTRALNTEVEGEITSNQALAKGDYLAKVTCVRTQPDTPYSLAYTVTTTPSSIPTFFTEDPEPDAKRDNSFILTGGSSLEGWLGVTGYPPGPTEIYDASDTYFFKVEKETSVRLKLEYDNSFKDNPGLAQSGGGDLAVHLSVNSPGHSFPGNAWTPIANWSESGFVTEPIRLHYSAGSIPPGFGIIVSLGDDFGTKPVGSYKLSIIVEEPPPEPTPVGLYVTVQEATWKKTLFEGQTVYYLEVKYEVENAYNVTKTSLKSLVTLFAPLAKTVPDITSWDNRGEMIDSLLKTSCKFGRINWPDFCLGESYFAGDCRYSTTQVEGLPDISIPARSKKNFTEVIPVSPTHYYSFDDSVQLIGVTIRKKDESSEGCYLHGLSFWPASAMVPGINLLLLKH